MNYKMVRNKLESLKASKFRTIKLGGISTSMNSDINNPLSKMVFTTFFNGTEKLILDANGNLQTLYNTGDRWDGHCMELRWGNTWY